MKRWVLVAVALATVAQAKKPVAATPPVMKGDPGAYFGPDFYPPAAIRNGEEGRAVAMVAVGADGAVVECSIAISSGSAALDAATCLGARRIVFEPAHDRRGRAVAGTMRLPIRWVLPTDTPAPAPTGGSAVPN